MKIFLFTLAMWVSTIGLFFIYGPIWLMAVRTGRWLSGNAMSHHFPSRYYTFSVIDRVSSPSRFRLAIAFLPIFLLFSLMICALLTVLLLHQVAP
jgi:hypothetical protein